MSTRQQADGNRSGRGLWAWQTVEATACGVTRKLQVVSFQAVWPEVLGLGDFDLLPKMVD